jgi:hypothetical protein
MTVSLLPTPVRWLPYSLHHESNESEEHHGYVVIANINSEHQAVIGGAKCVAGHAGSAEGGL